MIAQVLGIFHIESHEVVNKAIENFEKIYNARARAKSFRRGEKKEALTAAFVICNTLAQCCIPRPPAYVARYCGVEGEWRSILNIAKVLRIDLREAETAGLTREDFELQDSAPGDYIDTVCAHIGIPFNLASRMTLVADAAKNMLYGRYPTVIAAAAMQLVLNEVGLLTRLSARDVCDQLTCQQKSVDRAIARFKEMLVEERKGCQDGKEKEDGNFGEAEEAAWRCVLHYGNGPVPAR